MAVARSLRASGRRRQHGGKSLPIGTPEMTAEDVRGELYADPAPAAGTRVTAMKSARALLARHHHDFDQGAWVGERRLDTGANWRTILGQPR